MDKKWTKDEIAHKLATDDRWLIRGMIAIWERQTEDEQSTESTEEQNGVGFNGLDAPILSSMVAQIQRPHGRLSVRQMEVIRKMMKKYAGQLTKIANGAL